MTSFPIELPRSRRVAARFVNGVRRSLQAAFLDRPDVSQADIANELGVNRSVITRQLRGSKDLSLSRVAEIASVLGYYPEFKLIRDVPAEGANERITPAQFSSRSDTSGHAASFETASKVLAFHD